MYGWRPGAAHVWNSDRKQTTVWPFDRPSRSADHPTMKPLAIPANAIQNSSKTGDTVLDLFGGSGSTLIAAEQTGRICYTSEIDPLYADVIVTRYIGQVGSDKGVFLLRDGEKKAHADVAREVAAC
ncbi:DNA methyltransferase [Anaerospora hongkongensis]|nr:DNA methyltransferase [Anaerospora hongkongensis]